MGIHKALKKVRKQAGLSLEKAASHIGISGANFSRMENGLSKVTTDRLEELATLYGISASELLEGSIVTRPSTIDIDRMRQIVEAVQTTVNRLRVKPSPEKMGLAVSELYRLEIDHIVDHPKATFDPNRHVKITEAIFKK